MYVKIQNVILQVPFSEIKICKNTSSLKFNYIFKQIIFAQPNINNSLGNVYNI